MKKSLSRDERIRKGKDYQTVFKKASCISCRGAKCLYMDNGTNISRFAVTLTRKYGISVVRNRAKRQIREIFRLNKEKIKRGKDIVLILYPGDFTYKDRENQFLYLIGRADLIACT